ncbi:hypothetical protein Taro_024090 [Colocasia esculenta]|uniref:Trehalose-phosphatase n=1 Tax=Colocasia esculenta TaxID=4460 RepID=A0A843V6H3_COLES|nr:hypothetical protein [Colocasia esculenta]
MTKQNVVVQEAVTMAVPPAPAVANSSPMFPYPPPRAPPGYAIRKKLLKQLEIGTGINSGRISAWVESMRASSPTHDDGRTSWMLEHPSALSMFEEIAKMSKGKQIVMFLDYDGTLSPIVDDPECAFMSDAVRLDPLPTPTVPSINRLLLCSPPCTRHYRPCLFPSMREQPANPSFMRDAVRDVAKYFPTAIVSGRCRDKVYSFVQLAELYYAGSHGMDIKGPDTIRGPKCIQNNESALYQPASEFIPMIDEVYKALLKKTKSIPGAKVENNKFCLSVHFRCVDEKRWNGLAEQVKSVLREYPKLCLTAGRKVLEIRPTIKWDKGKALEFLLESLGLANCNDVLPVYIGDDRTDEDAFKVPPPPLLHGPWPCSEVTPTPGGTPTIPTSNRALDVIIFARSCGRGDKASASSCRRSRRTQTPPTLCRSPPRQAPSTVLFSFELSAASPPPPPPPSSSSSSSSMEDLSLSSCLLWGLWGLCPPRVGPSGPPDGASCGPRTTRYCSCLSVPFSHVSFMHSLSPSQERKNMKSFNGVMVTAGEGVPAAPRGVEEGKPKGVNSSTKIENSNVPQPKRRQTYGYEWGVKRLQQDEARGVYLYPPTYQRRRKRDLEKETYVNFLFNVPPHVSLHGNDAAQYGRIK